MRATKLAQAIKELATQGRLSAESVEYLDDPDDYYNAFKRLQEEVKDLHKVVDNLNDRLTDVESGGNHTKQGATSPSERSTSPASKKR